MRKTMKTIGLWGGDLLCHLLCLLHQGEAWNPVNLVTNGSQKSGDVTNRVVI